MTDTIVSNLTIENSKSLSERYFFVDRIRFVAIAIIVFGHSNLSSINLNLQGATLSNLVYSLSKFDIICMYIVSGFLMGSAIGKSNSYLLRRIQRTALPWLFWVTVFFIISIITIVFKGENLSSPISYLKLFFTSAMSGAYWFIPNYIFSLFIMFILIKHLPKYVVGIGLFMASMVYGANLYFEWFNTHHVNAWFGFMFYLWLGVQIKLNWSKVYSTIQKLKTLHCLGLIVLTGTLVIFESILLINKGSLDAANALKFSNHLYSLSWILLLVNLGVRLVPKFIDSRRESFGIYLVHSVIINIFIKFLNVLGITYDYTDQMRQIIVWILAFIVIYMSSLILVKFMVKLGLGFLVGDTKN